VEGQRSTSQAGPAAQCPRRARRTTDGCPGSGGRSPLRIGRNGRCHRCLRRACRTPSPRYRDQLRPGRPPGSGPGDTPGGLLTPLSVSGRASGSLHGVVGSDAPELDRSVMIIRSPESGGSTSWRGQRLVSCGHRAPRSKAPVTCIQPLNNRCSTASSHESLNSGEDAAVAGSAMSGSLP